MKRGYSSPFSPKIAEELDYHEARRYKKLIQQAHPTWTVEVINIAQGLNHLHVRVPNALGEVPYVLRTRRSAEECLT